MTSTLVRDENGQLTARVDTNAGAWLSDTITPSIFGQWLHHAGVAGAQDYTYDAAGRLTQAQDTPTGGVCATRSYSYTGTYGADSNRYGSTAYPSATDGSCQTSTGASTTSHSYDAADRLLSSGSDTGLVYDGYGRITTTPSADATGGANLSATYYNNDLVNTETPRNPNGSDSGYHLYSGD